MNEVTHKQFLGAAEAAIDSHLEQIARDLEAMAGRVRNISKSDDVHPNEVLTSILHIMAWGNTNLELDLLADRITRLLKIRDWIKDEK